MEERDPKALPRVERLEQRFEKDSRQLLDAKRRVALLEKRVALIERKTS